MFKNVVSTGNKIEKVRTSFVVVFVLIVAAITSPFLLFGIFRKREFDVKTKGVIVHVEPYPRKRADKVHYTYTVDGTAYEGVVPADEAAVQDAVAGNDIAVQYKLASPGESRLSGKERGASWGTTTGRVYYVASAAAAAAACRQHTQTLKSDNGNTRTVTKYACYVTYKYQTPDGNVFLREESRDTQTQYVKGAEIDVFYSSVDPRKARLISDDFRAIAGVALGVLLIVVGGVFLHYYLVSNVKGYGTLALASRAMTSKSFI